MMKPQKQIDFLKNLKLNAGNCQNLEFNSLNFQFDLSRTSSPYLLSFLMPPSSNSFILEVMDFDWTERKASILAMSTKKKMKPIQTAKVGIFLHV